MGPNASPEACVFVSLNAVGQAQDGTRQQYAVLYDANNNTVGSSWVKAGGVGGQNGKVFDVQVVIGWRDDNPTAVLPAASACGGPVHCVTLRSSIHRSQ